MTNTASMILYDNEGRCAGYDIIGSINFHDSCWISFVHENGDGSQETYMFNNNAVAKIKIEIPKDKEVQVESPDHGV